MIGAEGGSRTRTTLRSTDFKSVASAIPPPRHINQNSTQPEEATNPDSKILTDDKPSKLSWTVRGCGSVRTSSGQALAVGGPNQSSVYSRLMLESTDFDDTSKHQIRRAGSVSQTHPEARAQTHGPTRFDPRYFSPNRGASFQRRSLPSGED